MLIKCIFNVELKNKVKTWWDSYNIIIVKLLIVNKITEYVRPSRLQRKTARSVLKYQRHFRRQRSASDSGLIGPVSDTSRRPRFTATPITHLYIFTIVYLLTFTNKNTIQATDMRLQTFENVLQFKTSGTDLAI